MQECKGHHETRQYWGVIKISALVTIVSVFVSWYLNYRATELFRKQASIQMISTSSAKHISDATYVALNILNPKHDRENFTYEELQKIRKAISPQRQHLVSMAYCMHTAVCEDDLAFTRFCAFSNVIENAISKAHMLANEKRGKNDPIYQTFLLKCAEK